MGTYGDDFQQLEISRIVVANRVRRDLGDIPGLAASIHEHGMLNPIVVDDHLILVAGQRRLEAARSLGWTHVPARTVASTSAANHLAMEIDENTQRKSFSSDELADAVDRLDRLTRPSFRQHVWRWLTRVLAAVRTAARRVFGRRNT